MVLPDTEDKVALPQSCTHIIRDSVDEPLIWQWWWDWENSGSQGSQLQEVKISVDGKGMALVRMLLRVRPQRLCKGLNRAPPPCEVLLGPYSHTQARPKAACRGLHPEGTRSYPRS